MKIMLLIFAPFLLFQTASAQTMPESEQTFLCDGMLSKLDWVLSQALLGKNKDSLLIVIARSGTGEKSSINRQRLKSFESYSTGFRSFPKARLTLAEREKRNGLGILEFYIGGKLIDELFLLKKQKVCVSCC